jgi:hypothetical protein
MLFLNFGRHIAPDNNIGYGKATARFEHPKASFSTLLRDLERIAVRQVGLSSIGASARLDEPC